MLSAERRWEERKRDSGCSSHYKLPGETPGNGSQINCVRSHTGGGFLLDIYTKLWFYAEGAVGAYKELKLKLDIETYKSWRRPGRS